MKHILITSLFLLGMVAASPPVRAELVTETEARQVAENWVQLLIGLRGNWGGAEEARVSDVVPFRRDTRVLGYYCPVEPHGFVIVSLVRGLAPVKAYSETSRLDITSDEGPADLTKYQMERVLDVVEKQLGSLPSVNSEDVTALVGFDHRALWQMLDVAPKDFRAESKAAEVKRNYREGEILLSSSWHQGSPYYNQCPSNPAVCADSHCAVGCVATAAAQIIRYWSWPPGRDWMNMPDSVDSQNIPTPEQVAALSELCYAIGVALEMMYCEKGTCASGAYISNEVPMFEGWEYGDCLLVKRKDVSADVWWGGPGWIKDQLNVNRPILYNIDKHTIVLDGWREWYTNPQYHMNYGWDDNYNAWYVLDKLPQVTDTGTYLMESMVLGIVPNVRLGAIPPTGVISPDPFTPYRYVDVDFLGDNVTFLPGQLIQFLPRLIMKCVNGYIRIEGSPAHHTRLYTPDVTRGVKIVNGTMVIYPGGEVKFSLNRQRMQN